MTVKNPQPKKPAAKKAAAKKPAAKKPTRVLDLAHFSMQYSDTEKQKHKDSVKVFTRDYDAITGTEAGEPDTQRVLRAAAVNNGYRLFIRRSNWVAIAKRNIVPGSYRKGHEAMVPSEEVFGPGHDLHITWAGCEIEGLGETFFMAGHFATKGDPSAYDPARRVNVPDNRKYARGIGDLADKLGRGKSLVFYGGDQNILDNKVDTFFGEMLTSAGDELGKHPGTGHGSIDVMASYDKDGRVSASYFRALNDEKLFLHSDHYLIEAGFEVEQLRS